MTVLLGRTTAGSGTSDFLAAGDTGIWGPFVANASGALKYIYVITQNANATVTAIDAGAYADSAGEPAASPALCSGPADSLAIARGATVWRATMTVPANIVSGQSYWLGIHGATANFTFKGDASANAYRESAAAVDFPTWNPATDSNGGTTLIIWGEDEPASSSLPFRPILFMLDKFGSPNRAPFPAFQWASTDIAAGNQNVALTGLGSATAFGTVTTAVGNVNVVLVGLGTAASFGTAQINMKVVVTGLNSAAAFGTVTVSTSGSNQNVSMTGLGTAAAFGTLTIATGNTNITITGLGSAASFGALAKVNHTIHLVGLGTAASFGALTIATGNTNVLITGLGSAAAFGSLSASGGATPAAAPGSTRHMMMYKAK